MSAAAPERVDDNPAAGNFHANPFDGAPSAIFAGRAVCAATNRVYNRSVAGNHNAGIQPGVELRARAGSPRGAVMSVLQRIDNSAAAGDFHANAVNGPPAAGRAARSRCAGSPGRTVADNADDFATTNQYKPTVFQRCRGTGRARRTVCTISTFLTGFALIALVALFALQDAL